MQDGKEVEKGLEQGREGENARGDRKREKARGREKWRSGRIERGRNPPKCTHVLAHLSLSLTSLTSFLPTFHHPVPIALLKTNL